MITYEALAGLLNGTARRIAWTIRYSSRRVSRVESVAEHSYHTAFFCLMIGHMLHGLGYSVDMGKLLSRAIAHDLEETKTGDVLRHIKHSSPQIRDAMTAAGRKAIVEIAEETSVEKDWLLSLWENAKDDSLEGEIVSVSDVLSVIGYLREEYETGNRTLTDIWHEVLVHTSQLEQDIDCAELRTICEYMSRMLRELIAKESNSWLR